MQQFLMGRHYAKMLEDRCAEMASVIKAAGIPEIAVRKAVTFETAEFIYSSTAGTKE